jgi:two-component system, NarL family, response regulator NreC
LSIRILIADDHAVVRSGLRALLGTDPDLEFVGEAGDGPETLQLVETLQPDLVLLDITMPPDSGIEIARRIKEKHPKVLLLFLTMHEDEALLHEALRAGGAGYVIKRAEEAVILQAIHTVSEGDLYVHPSLTRALLQRSITSEQRRGAPVEPLTPRELDVLRLLARGNTNRQTAEVLGLSVRTVENHRANLMGKLGISSRVELVGYAEEHKLLE